MSSNICANRFDSIICNVDTTNIKWVSDRKIDDYLERTELEKIYD